MIDIDFETFAVVDIKMGPWRYAEDPETDVLCLRFKILDGENVLWTPGMPMPKWVKAKLWELYGPGCVVAHNAMFEKAIWRKIMVERLGWPDIADEYWKCSAAKCAAHSLPRDLGRVSIVLNTKVKKDEGGRRIMLKLAKPRKPTKNNPARRWTPATAPADFGRLYSYCGDDVEAEHCVDKKVRDLPASEYRLWQLDQRINSGGVYIDIKAVKGAIKIITAYEDYCRPRIEKLTGGRFNSTAQILEFKEWLREDHGIVTESLDKEAVENLLLRDDLPEEVREVLHIRQSLGKTSTKKLVAMLGAVCKDGRVKDLLMYHGASTGRWAGKNIQIQNFPRVKVDDLETKIRHIRTGDLDLVMMLYGDPMVLISSLLRGMIIAAPGNKIYVADYAAIEARGVCWLAGQESTLRLFREGKDVYRVMASAIYSKPLDQVDGGEKDGPERQLGKQATLGCIAENTLVYSDRGFIVIQDLQANDLLWNGAKWVRHGGLLKTGAKSVIRDEGLLFAGTPDHLILTNLGWQTFAETVADGRMRLPRSARSSVGGRLTVKNSKKGLSVMSPCAVLAALRKASGLTSSGLEKLKAVLRVLSPETAEKVETRGFIEILYLIRDLGRGGELLGSTLKSVAKTQVIRTTKTMVLEAYRSPSGVVETSWNILLDWMGSTLGISHSIELMSTEITAKEISAWLLIENSTETAECYDILDVDGGGFFQAGRVFAHNCGYQMGPPKFQLTCQKYKMKVDLPLAEKAVGAYRDTNDLVVKMWWDQERAAKKAIQTRRTVKCGKIVWGVVRGYLYCKLPSGRCLAYPSPKVEMGKTPWGEDREQISYMGLDEKNRWVRIRTYGGKLVENITQAVCRDIMAEAMLRLDAAGYQVRFTVHDEIVCETPKGFGSMDEFMRLLTESPKWAKGFPIKAEGWEGERYRK